MLHTALKARITFCKQVKIDLDPGYNLFVMLSKMKACLDKVNLPVFQGRVAKYGTLTCLLVTHPLGR